MRRFWIPSVLLLLFFLLVLAPAWAQVPGAQQPAPIVVRPAQFTGQLKSIEQFTSGPPDITLVPRGEGARRGRLWIRTASFYPFFGAPTSLFIAGKVEGPPPDFPDSRDMVPAKDHIEIWLAASRDVELPDIGWDNQFGQVTLPKGAASCEDWAKNEQPGPEAVSDRVKGCQEWAAEQVRYRQYFKRLFVRQWLLAPREQMELFATPAFEHIIDWYTGPNGSDDDFHKTMKPQGSLNINVFREPSGYSFAVFIPFDAFPPLPTLDTSELYVLVDVFSAAPPGKKMGAYSTSSPARVWGKPSTFNILRLDPPFSLPLTFCKLPLGETPKARTEHLTWVLPKFEGFSGGINILSDTFDLRNTFACGAWDPFGSSPWVYRTHHFWMGTRKEIGVWVCGPNLTIAKVGNSETFPFGKSETFPDVVGEEGLDYKQMPDGRLLIKFGPKIWEGTGCFQGGGAPSTDLRIFDLGWDMELHPALKLGDTIDGMNLLSQDFTVSPDWSQVTQYDLVGNQAARAWASITWCLKPNRQNEYIYVKCSESENVQPPNPPVLKELRQGYEEPPGAQTPPQTSENEIPKGLPTAGDVRGAPAGDLPSVVAVAPPPPVQFISPGRIRVAPEVEAAQLVVQTKPEYPPLAKMARIQGIVRLDAVIRKDGRVQNLRVISGHPLLVKAALDAVQLWLYQPTLYEVSTEIDVSFTLPE